MPILYCTRTILSHLILFLFAAVGSVLLLYYLVWPSVVEVGNFLGYDVPRVIWVIGIAAVFGVYGVLALMAWFKAGRY